MLSARRLPEGIALSLLVFLFAASVYRAWSLSIMGDEAYTYLSFVAPPLHQILTTYSPNHHVLYSLLAKLSVHLFGVSELSLRIPGLIGGLICFAAIAGLSRAMFGTRWTMLLSIALIAMNPLIFDFLSQARGYILAMGFYLAAVLYCGQFFSKPQLRRPSWMAAAGVALGLSLATNLTLAIPVAALNLLFAIAVEQRAPEFRRKAAGWLLLPELATAAAITAGPLLHADRQAFAGIGFNSLADSLNNFAVTCVLFDFDGNGLWHTRVDWAWDLLYPAFRVVLFITLGTVLFLFTRRALNSLWLYFFGGTLWLTIVMIVAAHYLTGAPYPTCRMVLYYWPLLAFTMCLLIQRFQSAGKWGRSFAALYLLFCVVMVIQSGTQFTLNHFGWRVYLAGTRTAANLIREQSTGDVTIAVSGSLYPCLDFYRSMYSMRVWKLMVYSASAASRDYTLIDMFDAAKGTPSGYRTVWRDPLSKAVLASPDSSPRLRGIVPMSAIWQARPPDEEKDGFEFANDDWKEVRADRRISDWNDDPPGGREHVWHQQHEPERDRGGRRLTGGRVGMQPGGSGFA